MDKENKQENRETSFWLLINALCIGVEDRAVFDFWY